MNEIFRPHDGLIFMKVGTHANETLDDIIARKCKEIDDVGYTFWGYGGNTCHPLTMVRPFAETYSNDEKIIRLAMQEMESNHFGAGVASEYSADGQSWEEIPELIEVRGSRFALAINNLRKTEIVLNLDQTKVPVGKSAGRSGSRYIKGRVDKACLEFLEAPELSNEPNKNLEIGLIADLVEPYAVFLQGERG